MKKWLYVSIFLIIIGIISGFFLWNSMVSPQYSLKQLDKAISKQNLIAFNKYVDLDKMVDSMIVQTWQYYSPGMGTETRWDAIRQEIGNSLLSVVKPNIKERIKEEVLRYIATGQWAAVETEDNNKISLFIAKVLKERIDPEQWDYQSINYAEIKGDNAHVGLTYYDQSKETNFLVEVKMRDMRGYWQIVEITNIAKLIDMSQI